jgi:hypothetical protein
VFLILYLPFMLATAVIVWRDQQLSAKIDQRFASRPWLKDGFILLLVKAVSFSVLYAGLLVFAIPLMIVWLLGLDSVESCCGLNSTKRTCCGVKLTNPFKWKQSIIVEEEEEAHLMLQNMGLPAQEGSSVEEDLPAYTAGEMHPGKEMADS